MKTVSKSSFTLFELLIVILIISIIYAIFVQKLSNKESVVKSKGIEAVGELLEGFEFNSSADIICTDSCKECAIYIDGKKVKEIPSPFEKEPKIYDFDIHGLLSRVTFTPLFDENDNPKEVCFKYSLYPNRSKSSYIMEYKDKYYVFFAYLHPVEKTESIQKAQELYDPSQWVPTDSSEYNP